MSRYYRVMLGKKGAYAPECFTEGFIGSGFGCVERDIGRDLTEDLRPFNRHFIPQLQEKWPEKSKIALGLWCGFTWTICKGIRTGDFVLCPDGAGNYRVGEVVGDYAYVAGGVLPHRRPVRWLTRLIARTEMSEALRRSAGSAGTVSEVSRHREELQQLIDGGTPELVASDPAVEDPTSFALERHLQEFLIDNWPQTELGRQYDIYTDDGEVVGSQFLTDTGPMDILAVSKDKRILLVVELKKGRASDAVVGQTLRYMGYVQDELAEAGQLVRGVVIALEDDRRIRRALSMTPAIDFYRYEIGFRLVKS
jgi:restriction system protein